MEAVPALVEIGDYRLAPPVAVPVDDIAAIALREQLGVVMLILGPLVRPGADADLSGDDAWRG